MVRELTIKTGLFLFLQLFISVLIAGEYEIIPQVANNPWCTVISNDNKYVYSGQSDGSVLVTEISTGYIVKKLKGHTDGVLCLAISNDNKFLLSGSGRGDKSVILWDINKGEKITQFRGAHEEGNVLDVEFIEGQNKILTAGQDEKLALWDMNTGNLIRVFDGKYEAYSHEKMLGRAATIRSHEGPVLQCIYLKSRNEIVSRTKNEFAFWNIETGERTYLSKIIDVTAMALYPDEKYLALGLINGSIHNFDINLKKVEKSYQIAEKEIKWVSFDSAGKRLCYVDGNKTIAVYNLETKKIEKELSEFHDFAIFISHDLKFATNGLFMYKPMEIWDIENGYQLNSKNKGLIFPISGATVSSNGNYLISNSKMHNKISIWDLNNLKKVNTVSTGQTLNMGVYITPDEKHFLASDVTTTLKLYKTKTGQLIRTYTGHTGIVSQVIFFEQGNKFLTAGEDKFIGIWDMKQTSPVNKLIGHRDQVSKIAITPDEKYLISGGKDKMLFIWDLSTGAMVKKLFAHSAEITSIAISPDQKYVASAAKDKRLCLWDIATWKMVKEFKLDEYCHSIAFTSDSNQMIYSMNYSNQLNFIDLETFNNAKTYESNVGSFVSLSNIPNSNKFLSITSDGSVRIWNESEEKWTAFISDQDQSRWAIYNQDNYWDGSYHCGDMFIVVKDNKAYDIRQLALSTNRPDLILKNMGNTNTQLISQFLKQYKRRLAKAGYTTDIDIAKIKAPELQIINHVQSGLNSNISVKYSDSNYGLKSYQVLVNGVPVYGKAGKPLTGNTQTVTENIILSEGDNRIEVYCTNKFGTESLSDIVYAKGELQNTKDLYVISIGVSNYKNPGYNLKYAAKDATDLKSTLEQLKGKGFSNVFTKSLVNEQVTPEAIKACKPFLSKAQLNDGVIIFLAGHGMYNPSDDEFYFLTYSADLNNLKNTAANYKIIEDLLSGITARNKLLLLDACESGEKVDLDNSDAMVMLEASGINSRGFKVKSGPATAQSKEVISSEIFQKDRYIFNDIIVRNGAIVFSSSASNELSYESMQLQNGFFTSALIEGINGRADLDNNGFITIAELKEFVSTSVSENTTGLQNPTIDRDNFYQNFSIKIY